jgi:hypothetical protein
MRNLQESGINNPPASTYGQPMKTLLAAFFFLSYGPIASAATCPKLLSKDGKSVSPSDFLPAGFVLAEEIPGDLNKDATVDCVLLIKGTDKTKFVQDKDRGRLDRNRRGILVLLNKHNGYQQVFRNDRCFSSENEDGGVYYAPELSLNIEKDNLIVHYGHGRYGYWKYTFRLKDSEFELIGYDNDNGGPMLEKATSINFLTKKKLKKENVNPDPESDREVIKETWSKIKLPRPILLSEIKDFDDLDMSKY